MMGKSKEDFYDYKEYIESFMKSYMLSLLDCDYRDALGHIAAMIDGFVNERASYREWWEPMVVENSEMYLHRYQIDEIVEKDFDKFLIDEGKPTYQTIRAAYNCFFRKNTKKTPKASDMIGKLKNILEYPLHYADLYIPLRCTFKDQYLELCREDTNNEYIFVFSFWGKYIAYNDDAEYISQHSKCKLRTDAEGWKYVVIPKRDGTLHNIIELARKDGKEVGMTLADKPPIPEYSTLKGVPTQVPRFWRKNTLKIGDTFVLDKLRCRIVNVGTYQHQPIIYILGEGGEKYKLFVSEVWERIGNGTIREYQPTPTPLQALWIECCFYTTK